MRKLCLVLILFCVVGLVDDAFARSSGGGGGSSGGSHSSRTKSSDGYMTKSCKTSACFKKHPSGHYGFETGKKKH